MPPKKRGRPPGSGIGKTPKRQSGRKRKPNRRWSDKPKPATDSEDNGDSSSVSDERSSDEDDSCSFDNGPERLLDFPSPPKQKRTRRKQAKAAPAVSAGLEEEMEDDDGVVRERYSDNSADEYTDDGVSDLSVGADSSDYDDVDFEVPIRPRRGRPPKWLQLQQTDPNAPRESTPEWTAKHCPWLPTTDGVTPPPLTLPPSSADLPPIGTNNDAQLLAAVEVYEVFRRYGVALKLSPFTVENWLAALASADASALLAEAHICLLRMLLADDEREQIITGPLDLKESQKITLFLLDHCTYAEVLRQYVVSVSCVSSSEVENILSTCNYPFTGVKQRIVVLKWLQQRFIETCEYRQEEKRAEIGKVPPDEHCRDCGKAGEVVCCDGCSAVYHLRCLDPPLKMVPDGEWYCPICLIHQVPGVFDCGGEQGIEQCRQDSLGRDRHGNTYHFLVRRIFVEQSDPPVSECNTTVRYYSTVVQLRQLIRQLDETGYERLLCDEIRANMEEICRQMELTLRLTLDCQPSGAHSYLNVTSRTGLKEIERDRDEQLSKTPPATDLDGEKERHSLLDLLDEKLGLINLPTLKRTDSTTDDAPPALESELVMKNENAEPVLNKALLGPELPAQLQLNRSAELHRLGIGAEYRLYENLYSANDYAKTPYERAQERDRLKHMSNKFCFSDHGAFTWPGLQSSTGNGNKTSFINRGASEVSRMLAAVFRQLQERMPLQFMHRRWTTEAAMKFATMNQTSVTSGGIAVSNLVEQLTLFERCLKDVAMNAQWRDLLGHTQLFHTSVEDKDRLKKREAKRERHRRELLAADPTDEDADVVWVKYTKTDGPPRHAIWKLKDEQYRVNGLGQLGGWYFAVKNRSLLLSRRPKETEVTKKRRMQRLEKLVSRFTESREQQALNDHRGRVRSALTECYSPNCRARLQWQLVCGPDSPAQRCYSSLCRERVAAANLVQPRDTQGVVKVCPAGKLVAKKDAAVGKSVAYPLPTPHRFRCNLTKRQNILILPKYQLRKLAKFGGLRVEKGIDGFNLTHKGNQYVWPYPCARPLFSTCWKYMTCTARSYHAVALQFRILFHSIRWQEVKHDMPPNSRMSVATYNGGVETRELVGHRESPPYGLRCRFQLHVHVQPPSDEENEEEMDADTPKHTPGRRGGGGRNLRQTPSQTKKDSPVVSSKKKAKFDQVSSKSAGKFVDRWVDEVDLELWEIRHYWMTYERRRTETTVREQTAIVGGRQRIVINVNGGAVGMPSKVFAPVQSRPITLANGPRVPGIIRKQSTTVIHSPGRGRGGTPVAATYMTAPRGGSIRHMAQPGQPLLRNDQPVNAVQTGQHNYYAMGRGRGVANPARIMPRPTFSGNVVYRNTAGGGAVPTTTQQAVPIVPGAIMNGRVGTFNGQPVRLVRRVTAAGPQTMVLVRPMQPGAQMAATLVRAVAPTPQAAGGVHRIVSPNAVQESNLRPVMPQAGRNYVRMQMQTQPLGMRTPLGSPSKRGAFRGPPNYEESTPNEDMDQETYAELAQQGIRPAGRPPDRLQSVFGLGSRQVVIDGPPTTAPLLSGRGSGGVSGRRLGPVAHSTPTAVNQQPDSEPMETAGPSGDVFAESPPPTVVPSTLHRLRARPVSPPVGTFGIPSRRYEDHLDSMEQQLLQRQASKEELIRQRWLETKKARGEQRPVSFAAPPPLPPMRTPLVSAMPRRPEGGWRLEQESPQDYKERVKREATERRQQKAVEEADKKRIHEVRMVILDLMQRVMKQEKNEEREQKKQMFKEYRKEYDRRYRIKKALLKQLESQMTDKMNFIRREILKRRYPIERKAEKETGITFESLKESFGPVFAVGSGGGAKKRKLSERLGASASATMPSSSSWQPPKSVATLAAANVPPNVPSFNRSPPPKAMRPLTSFVPRSTVVSNPSGELIDTSKLHCKCRTYYDPKRFYIACDLCSQWFHGSCVGVGEKKAKKMDSWSCDECNTEREQSKQQLYCVCRSAYDESQFYVGCDGCEGWFHPRCVGITQQEAESMSYYLCPNCHGGGGGSGGRADVSVDSTTSDVGELTREDYPRLWRVFDALMENRNSWPFREPVDLDRYPNYTMIVRKPIDLSTVQRRLESLEYHRLKDFVADVGLIFNNARLYNPKDSPVFQCADILEKRFTENLQAVKEEMTSEQHPSSSLGLDAAEMVEEEAALDDLSAADGGRLFRVGDDKLQLFPELDGETVIVVDDEFLANGNGHEQPSPELLDV